MPSPPRCEACGTPLASGARACPGCGLARSAKPVARRKPAATPPVRKEATTPTVTTSPGHPATLVECVRCGTGWKGGAGHCPACAHPHSRFLPAKPKPVVTSVPVKRTGAGSRAAKPSPAAPARVGGRGGRKVVKRHSLRLWAWLMLALLTAWTLLTWGCGG